MNVMNKLPPNYMVTTDESKELDELIEELEKTDFTWELGKGDYCIAGTTLKATTFNKLLSALKAAKGLEEALEGEKKEVRLNLDKMNRTDIIHALENELRFRASIARKALAEYNETLNSLFNL